MFNKKNNEIKNEKEIKEVLEGSETYIVASDKGIIIYGSTPAVLNAFSRITKEMKGLHNVDEKMIKRSFDLGNMSEEELTVEAKKLIDKLLKKVEEKVNE